MMEVNIGGKNISIGTILAVVGGILGIISLFLAWSYWSGNVTQSASFTGMSLLDGIVYNGQQIAPADELTFVRFMPILTLVFGIIAVIGAILPMVSNIDQKISSIICAVSGLLMVVFAVLFMVMGSGSGLFVHDYVKAFIDGLLSRGVTIGAGIGCYLGLIGGVLALVGGGSGLIKSR